MSSTKTNAEMLKTIKSYNKEAREKKAKKEGFPTSADLILYLEGEIKQGAGGSSYAPSGSKKTPCPTTTKAPTAKSTSKSASSSWPTIHVVDIVDKSGSMNGGKDHASVKGVNAGVDALVNDPADVNYTYTLCDFSDDIVFRNVVAPLNEVKHLKAGTRGSTALFDAIGKSVEHVKPHVRAGNKVLVNIYTDGQENSSRHFTREAINSLIKSLSGEGWTFTFIGTDVDVRFVQQNLSVDASNTLAYDGTAQGLEKSFASNTRSRSAYSAKVSAGEDVSKGFFKDIN